VNKKSRRKPRISETKSPSSKASAPQGTLIVGGGAMANIGKTKDKPLANDLLENIKNDIVGSYFVLGSR
jgi:hypothetical protein